MASIPPFLLNANKSYMAMSVPPNSQLLMASVTRNGMPARESFHKFFECWLVEQNQYLQELTSASTLGSNGSASASDAVLQPLIDRVVRHYESYYRTKSQCTELDVLSMFSPSWRSSLEEAFIWVGGWRPTMAFHLLYSKSGLQVETQLEKLIRGLSTGDLADLSSEQLSRVDKLHRRTVVEEKEISEKLAKHQETAADASAVELSHIETEMLLQDREVSGEGGDDGGGVEEQVRTMIAAKEHRLEEILKMADELRLSTLKEILKILKPMQGVHFLIAAAELHLRFHDWGKKRDAQHALPGR